MIVIEYSLTKERRKELAEAIAGIRGANAVYDGAPWFTYSIGDIKVNRNGKVEIPVIAEAPELVSKLLEKGFRAVDPLAENMGEEDPSADAARPHCIGLPKSLFTIPAMENLHKIIDSKRSLLCEALGTEEIPVLEKDGKLLFPWFPDPMGPVELKAHMHLVTALADMARNAKRVNTVEKETDNHKYAFRCFLLRLGFIGDEYKDERKVLLARLSGSSAFRNGRKGGEEE